MFNQFPSFYTGVENRQEHLRKIFSSAAYFAISFILVNYTSHAWSSSNAWDLGFRPLFNYSGMDVLQETQGWSVQRIAWVYLAPPLWGLLISLVALSCFKWVDGTKAHLRTFLFWLAVNGYLLYFSYIITGVISGQDYSSKLFTGFVSYYSWLLWSKPKIYGILLLQTLVSLIFPLLFSKAILQLNYSRLLAAKNNSRLIIALFVVVLPVLIGSALVVLSTFPMDMAYQVVRIFCLLPIFIVAFLGMGFHKAKHISIAKGGMKAMPLVVLILVYLLILASRFGLSIRTEPFW